MKQYVSVDKPKQRNTNLELFRVITMLLIIAHHYVVNSGLVSAGSPVLADPMSRRSLFLLLLGAWGKTGINCFVLITGYFMCRSSISAKKFFKLYFTIVFYYLVIHSIFGVTGYNRFSWQEAFRMMIPFVYVADGFAPAFLLFYLCIPFLNLLLQNLSQRMHAYLLVFLFCLYVIPGTLRFVFFVQMNYVSWFVVLYFLAAYVRIYPNSFFENTKFWGISSLGCMALGAISVVACTWLGAKRGQFMSYYFVADSNTLLAVATGFSSFMFFKNAKIPYNRTVNKLASTCFGVLCFHASSDVMRRWLWVDTLNNVGVYHESWMPLHVILSTLGIFLVGAGIDSLRMRFVEEPFFRFWDRYWGSVTEKYRGLEKKLFQKLNIQD